MFRGILVNKLIGKCFAIIINKFVAIILMATNQILDIDFILQHVASVKQELSCGQKFLIRNNLQTLNGSVNHIQIAVIFKQYTSMPYETSEFRRRRSYEEYFAFGSNHYTLLFISLTDI